MSTLVIPPVGFDVKIIDGPDKGKTGRVVNIEYGYITVEYWDTDFVLEPGIYRKYIGAVIEIGDSIPKFFKYEDYSCDKDLLIRMLVKSEVLTKYSTGLIPFLPLTKRKLYTGDTIQDKKTGTILKVEKVNYSSVILGSAISDRPVVIGYDPDTGERFGFKHISEFTFRRNGLMSNAVMADSTTAKLDQIKLKIMAGIFHAVRKNESESIYYTAEELKGIKLTDTQFLFPYDSESVRYVVMDTKEIPISPENLTALRSFHNK